MTLDEAIKKFGKITGKREVTGRECAQVAGWLRELRKRREAAVSSPKPDAAVYRSLMNRTSDDPYTFSYFGGRVRGYHGKTDDSIHIQRGAYDFQIVTAFMRNSGVEMNANSVFAAVHALPDINLAFYENYISYEGMEMSVDYDIYINIGPEEGCKDVLVFYMDLSTYGNKMQTLTILVNRAGHRTEVTMI